MHQIETHFERALALGTDNDEAWLHIETLRKIGTDDVFRIAFEFCRSTLASKRSIGVCVLAQIGDAGLSHQKAIADIIAELIAKEHDTEVVTSIISAISFQNIIAAVPWLIEKSSSADEDIRWRIAWALPLGLVPNDPHYDEVISALLRLSRDVEPQVRDWATFSLATQIDDGSELVASALLNRVEDCDFDTRSEALVGLARRADLRVIPYLCNELCSDRVGQLAVESAKILARTELLAPLQKLSKWWDVDSELLAEAIEACSGSFNESVNHSERQK